MNIAKDTLNKQVLLLENSIAPIKERIEQTQPKVDPRKNVDRFFANLKFGAVFLVQQILQDFPFTLSTNFFVIVATPETRLKKLRATLSLFKINLALP